MLQREHLAQPDTVAGQFQLPVGEPVQRDGELRRCGFWVLTNLQDRLLGLGEIVKAEQRTREAGFDAYVRKPFVESTLAAAVDRVVQSRRVQPRVFARGA